MRLRQGVRAVVLDPDDRVLLVRFEFPDEQLLTEFVTGMRWWTQEELASSDELFAPRRLPELVAALLRDGPPGEPVDVGV